MLRNATALSPEITLGMRREEPSNSEKSSKNITYLVSTAVDTQLRGQHDTSNQTEGRDNSFGNDADDDERFEEEGRADREDDGEPRDDSDEHGVVNGRGRAANANGNSIANEGSDEDGPEES